MNLIEWDKSLEVRINQIDSEHKVFVSIIEKIEKEILNNGDKEYIVNLFAELLKFTDFHFCREENVMLLEKYPDIERHKTIHKNLIKDLQDKIYVLNSEYIHFGALLAYLVTWFNTHTSKEDMLFASYLQSKQL